MEVAEKPVARNPKAKSRKERCGALFGGRIVHFLDHHGEASAGAIARHFGIEVSYVRRTCRRFVQEGLLDERLQKQSGTRPVKMYRYLGK